MGQEQQPNWYPKNADAIHDKCNEDHPLSLEIKESLRNRHPIDNPQVHGYFLCKAKGMNIYAKETGINVDRMSYTFYKNPKQSDCIKPVVEDCVNKHKDVTSEGAMIFKVIKCVVDVDNDNTYGCQET